MNRCSDDRDRIQLVGECRPDPIDEQRGSRHTATLDNNTNRDLYDTRVTIAVLMTARRTIALNPPGCATGCAMWDLEWGPVPGGLGNSTPPIKVVLANRPPALVRENIDTTVTWTLSASQPLVPAAPAKVFMRTCFCSLTVLP
jgi:hypothetical protein